jgi:hypothetical protein
VSVYAFMDVRLYMQVLFVHACMYVGIYVYTCVCAWARVYVYAYVYVRMCVGACMFVHKGEFVRK